MTKIINKALVNSLDPKNLYTWEDYAEGDTKFQIDGNFTSLTFDGGSDDPVETSANTLKISKYSAAGKGTIKTLSNGLWNAQEDTKKTVYTHNLDLTNITLTTVYGGALMTKTAKNMAVNTSSTASRVTAVGDVSLSLKGVKASTVYGGGAGYGSTLNGNVDIVLTGSNIGTVYGGGYNDAVVNGDVKITVDSSTANKVSNIYAGGFNADVRGSAAVQFTSGDVSSFKGKVYGSGRGGRAYIKGDTSLLFDDATGNFNGTIYDFDKVRFSGETAVTFTKGQHNSMKSAEYEFVVDDSSLGMDDAMLTWNKSIVIEKVLVSLNMTANAKGRELTLISSTSFKKDSSFDLDDVKVVNADGNNVYAGFYDLEYDVYDKKTKTGGDVSLTLSTDVVFDTDTVLKSPLYGTDLAEIITLKDSVTVTGTINIGVGDQVFLENGSRISGTMNWDVRKGATGPLNGFQMLDSGCNLLVTVAPGKELGRFVIATGDFSGSYQSDFTLTGGEGTAVVSVGAGSVMYNDIFYKLSVDGDKLFMDSYATKKLTITACDGAKKYDGTALSVFDYKVAGDLLIGDELVVTVEGSIIDAGSAANKIASYSILRNGEDVTREYAVTTVDGTLEVAKRDVTMTSGSAEKYYDLTPLTNSTVTVTGDGFVKGEGAVYNVTGSQTEIGTSKNTFTYELTENTKAGNYNITTVEGGLTVLKNTNPITITADSASKMYDGTALSAGYSFTQGILLACDELVVTLDGSITNAGTAANKVVSYKVMRGEQEVTGEYNFAACVDGVLSVTKRDVTLTSATDSKMYDGTPLTNSAVTVSGSGFVEGQGATYDVTGSQTEVGTSKNIFSYKLNEGTDANNYNITTVEGDLTVTPKKTPITITAGSAYKMYDGTALTCSGYTFTPGILAEGDELSVTVEGSITNAGGVFNKVTSYKVMRGEEDVTSEYLFNTENGVLSVTKRYVEITSASANKTYDGTALTCNEAWISGGDGFISGEGFTYECTGSQTDVGTSKNTFTVEGTGNTNLNNYNIVHVEGDLTVYPKKGGDTLVITANSGTKMYDGKELTVDGYSYTEGVLKDGDVLTVTGQSGSSLTDAGEVDHVISSYKIMRGGEDVTTEYKEAVLVNGKLTVTQRQVTLTSVSDTKKNDGTPLTNDTIVVSGDGFVNGQGATYVVTGIQNGVGSSQNTFTYELKQNTKSSNYNITTKEGVLTVLERPALTITIDDVSWNYNGKNSYVASSASIKGLEDGYTCEITVEAPSANADFYGQNYTVNYSIFDENKKDVTGGYTDVTINKGNLTINKQNVTITSDSDWKYYDGTPLTKNSTKITSGSFSSGEGYSADVTGSQTEIGTSKNTFTYKLNEGTDANNYNITTVEGDLTVKKISLWISINGTSRTYDGTDTFVLKDSEYTITEGSLVYGDTITITNTTTSADAGAYAYNCTIQVFDRDGNDVTNHYNINQLIFGKFTITPRKVNLTSSSAIKEYDGKELVDHTITVSGDGFVDGQGATYDVTGSQTKVGCSWNEFTYKLNENTKDDNYDIAMTFGDLNVTPNRTPILIESNDDTKTYDGTPLTNSSYSYTGDLAEGDYLDSVTVTGSITDVGTAPNTITKLVVKNQAGDDVTSFYADITTVYGTLNVTKRNVKITSGSATKPYDGTPLTDNTITVSGDGFVAGQGADYDVTGSQTEVGTSSNTFTYKLKQDTKETNYNITKVEGSLEVTAPKTVAPKMISMMKSGNDSQNFDSVLELDEDDLVFGEGNTFSDDLFAGQYDKIDVSGKIGTLKLDMPAEADATMKAFDVADIRLEQWDGKTLDGSIASIVVELNSVSDDPAKSVKYGLSIA